MVRYVFMYLQGMFLARCVVTFQRFLRVWCYKHKKANFHPISSKNGKLLIGGDILCILCVLLYFQFGLYCSYKHETQSSKTTSIRPCQELYASMSRKMAPSF